MKNNIFIAPFNRILWVTLMLLCCNDLVFSQIDEELKADIRNTGIVHSPLSLDYSKAFETIGLTKKVLVGDMLCDMDDIGNWSHTGIGGMSQTDERSIMGKYSLRVVAPSRSEVFPPRFGMGFGTSKVDLAVGGVNWEKYNRIMFWIYPDCEGVRSGIYMNLALVNESESEIPNQWGRREGTHEINLINRQWNQCFLEITEFPRDNIIRLSFSIETFGKELTMGNLLQFDIDAIELQLIEDPEIASGWMPAPNRIIYSTTGYGKDSKKSAIVRVNNHNGIFKLFDFSTNRPVYEGQIKSVITPIGKFEIIDFSDFEREGQFVIKAGDITTPPFYINNNIWDNSAWRILNFLFCQRCGYPVPEKHTSCHADHNAEHNGKRMTLNGGWHDAGDLSQNPKQTAEIVQALFEMAKRANEKGNTELYLRLLEEAQWGLDYILRARFGDGYRISRAMTNLWTDRLIGTVDDSRQVIIRNGAWENFIYAAVSAYASMSIEKDLIMKEFLERVAKEDFGFAMERFEKVEKEPLLKDEHPNSDIKGIFSTRVSPCQYMATISWAASMLYKLTGDTYYAEKAAHHIKYTLDCQRTEPLKDKDGISGFFYQSLNKNSIVHFNHQTEDQVFMTALTLLCETQPNHSDFKRWDNSIRLYADYLKKITQYVQPYAMLPSGVYHIDEPIRDSLAFYTLHLGVRRDVLKDYREQLENGFKLDDEHYLKAFPVWFSFRGNTAVHLATGKAAALCGKYLNDNELLNIAEQQLFWTVGKNPFGQSLIWGEGHNYMQQYAPLPGETVGQIPVGIQTRGNEDVPYWPQFNYCTYKEVWVKSAGKWLSLIAEF